MALEIERKFFLKRFPNKEIAEGTLNLFEVQQIDQTYLALQGDEEIRVRKIQLSPEAGNGEKSRVYFTHTFKKGHGLVKEETEYKISKPIYDQLMKQSGAVPLQKKRTVVKDASHTMEIDEYDQFDLKVVEVEFNSEKEAQEFKAPAWFGEEIQPGEGKSNKKLWKILQKGSQRTRT